MCSVAAVGMARDARPLPYPIHGKHARQVQLSTGRASWTWASWAEWHKRAVERRSWRKSPIRRMLELRASEAAKRQDTRNYFSASAIGEWHGMIYGAYHFPTGKWYVGQTVNTVQQRAREHWWARNSARDYLHLTLADDPDPMCWVAFPLEAIPKELWQTPSNQRLAGWRKNERAKFRALATPREQYWVNLLQSMWPKGWNSQYPGKPARAGYQSSQAATPQREAARDLEAARAAITKWEANPRAARSWLIGAEREELVEILEGLQKGLHPS